MQNNINSKYVDLVAHEEHIIDDVSICFEELDDATQYKIVHMVQVYITAAVNTVLEYPDWFKSKNKEL